MTKTSKTDTISICDKKCDFSKTTAHYHEGKSNKIALVFSCPGSEEKGAGKPIAGSTGAKFEALLDAMHKKNKLNDYKCRYDFRITNAWAQVEATKRTEATDKEIAEKKNIARLQKELCDITDYIIGFGRKAETALSLIEPNLKAKVIGKNVMHPSRKKVDSWVKKAVKILEKELK